MPPLVKPMLASPPKAGDRPVDLAGRYAFDIKLDGIRALAYYDGNVVLINRSGVDITHRYPEVVAGVEKLGQDRGGIHFTLDGEIVANTGSFQDTSKRDKQNKPGDVALTMRSIPVSFIAFDLLHLGEHDLRPLPFSTRRAHLVDNVQATGTVCHSVLSHDAGFFELVKAQQMEGVIAKRLNSPYRAGRFSDWIKFKAVRSITCVGVGYEKGTGARAHFGAMFLALVSDAGITEVGRVGTGFTASEIAMLKGEMDAGRPVVVEIECLNKSKDGKLRFPVYKGIRTDLSVQDARLDQLLQIPTM